MLNRRLFRRIAREGRPPCVRGPLSFLTIPLVQRRGTPTYEGARSSRRAHSASEDEQGSTDARGGCAPARGPFGYTSLRNSGVVIHPLQTKRGEAKHRKKSPARNGHELAPRAVYASVRTPRVSLPLCIPCVTEDPGPACAGGSLSYEDALSLPIRKTTGSRGVRPPYGRVVEVA